MVPPAISRVAAYALIGVGMAVTLAGVIWCANTALFVASAKRTEGEIVRFDKVATRGGWSSHPVFSYRDSSGHRWEGTTDFSSAEFKVGQKVQVSYDPAAPMSSSLDSLRASWASPVLILVWGVGFLIFAWRMYKKEKSLTNRHSQLRGADAPRSG